MESTFPKFLTMFFVLEDPDQFCDCNSLQIIQKVGKTSPNFLKCCKDGLAFGKEQYCLNQYEGRLDGKNAVCKDLINKWNQCLDDGTQMTRGSGSSKIQSEWKIVIVIFSLIKAIL